MEKRFYTTGEVAELLRISQRTLQNYVGKHAVYRPDRPGLWHVDHVNLIVKVWANILSADEGLTLWSLERERMCTSGKLGLHQ